MAHIQEISAAAAPSLSLAPSLRLEEPQQQTKTQVAGHRRKRSIGDDAERTRQAQRMLKELENTVDGFIEKSSDEDYEELEEIKETIGKISKKLKAIEKYRAKHPGRVIKIISFSAVEETDLIALGLKGTPEVVVADKFQEMIDRFLTSLSSAEETPLNPLLEPKEAFTHGLQKIDKYVNLGNEAGARLIINHFLLALIDIGAPVGLHIFIWPELRLTEMEAPVRIDYKEVTTFLSGITDYGIASVVDGPPNHLSIFKGEAQTVTTLQRSAEWRKTFWVLEAKARDVALESCLPRAIAQCIVLALQSFHDTDSSSFQIAMFCLTNGWKWIFGAIVRSPNGTINCRRTAPLCITDQDWRSTHILKALFVWTTTPSHVIWEDMSKLSCLDAIP